MLAQSFIEEMKARLLKEKQRLQTELKNLPGHIELGARQDDNALEVEEDDVNRGIKIRLQADLKKIEKALAKIESGVYGRDDEGNAIPQERLRALPWADKAI